MSELTLKQVFNALKNGNLVYHKIRPKDATTRKRLDVYDIWYLVYDQNKKVVHNFYVCQKCGELMNVNLKTKGNSRLLNHPCCKEHVAKLEAEKKAEDAAKKLKLDEAAEDDSETEDVKFIVQLTSDMQQMKVESGKFHRRWISFGAGTFSLWSNRFEIWLFFETRAAFNCSE